MSVGAEFYRVSRKKFQPSRVPLKDLDHAAKWEGQPLTCIDDAEGEPIILEPNKEAEETEKWYKSPKMFIKVMIPHVALITILLSYTSLGAVVLQVLESDVEVLQRREKLDRILAMYDRIINESWDLHHTTAGVSQDLYGRQMYSSLVELSRVHDDQLVFNASDIHTKWTFPSAVLYILTILTTCGYDHVGPLTDIGKIFSVAFALVGIPLTFITAADIGKFLSEVMYMSIRYGSKLTRHLRKCWASKKGSKDQNGGEELSGKKLDKNQNDPDDFPFDLDGEELEYKSLWFPIGAYIGLICMYCSLGSLLYFCYEDNWGFIKGFHFSFNTITTVGLGNIAVADWLYLVFNVAYIIVGLAVVTMCVDLASTHLKAYFTQIHYFGRARPFFGINDEIREMLAAMRKKKGGRVTWNDIKQYLEADALVTLRPFIPRNIHLWRYVDETSSQLSTARQNSVASELMSTRRPSQLRTDQQLSARNSLSPMVDNSNNSSRR